MPSLFIEFYSEEIPARLQMSASNNLKESIINNLQQNHLNFGSIREFYGSKRIATCIENVSKKQSDSKEEKRGPRVDANKQAIEGFARSFGVSTSKLVLRETQKGSFFFYTSFQKGRTIQELLPNIINNIINNFPWPKSQKWGSGSLKWIRPLKNITVLYDGKIVKCKIGDENLYLQSTNFTFGHSFLKKEKIFFRSHIDYVNNLKKGLVLVDPYIRKNEISNQLSVISKKMGLSIIYDDKTLDEVNGLVEWPNALIGKIDEKFMNLPKEVLITVMRVHQKYFALQDKNNLIQPYFIVVSNMPKQSLRDKNIIFGNEKVLRARLADAKFHWENDRSKNFSEMLYKLKNVSYFEGLGSLYDKSIRLEKISEYISNLLKFKNVNNIKRAALLCKIDLITGMVGEFPELQGVMGGYYSSKEGKDIPKLISGHYKPKGSFGEISKNIGINILSLTDKIDHLAGFFSIDKKPSGSKDPFALRRSALGIVRIIIESNISINIDKLIEFTTNLFKNNDLNLNKQIKSFIEDRFSILLREKEIKYDVINCFMGDNLEYLYETYDNIIIMDAFMQTENGKNLKSLWFRVSNILNTERKNQNKIDVSEFEVDSSYEKLEIKLVEKIKEIKSSRNFLKVLKQRALLKKPTDDFFENLQINDPNPDIKKRRIIILSFLKQKLLEIGNLEALEG